LSSARSPVMLTTQAGPSFSPAPHPSPRRVETAPRWTQQQPRWTGDALARWNTSTARLAVIGRSPAHYPHQCGPV
jgi:hypothetical protein